MLNPFYLSVSLLLLPMGKVTKPNNESPRTLTIVSFRWLCKWCCTVVFTRYGWMSNIFEHMRGKFIKILTKPYASLSFSQMKAEMYCIQFSVFMFIKSNIAQKSLNERKCRKFSMHPKRMYTHKSWSKWIFSAYSESPVKPSASSLIIQDKNRF